MMWIDFAIAAYRDAEQAFFDLDGHESDDDIPRMQLRDFSDFELTHLGMLLCNGYAPELVLDGDAPDELITACDPALIAALARLDERQQLPLAARWREACGLADAEGALAALTRFAATAHRSGLPVLYAQGCDRPEPAD